MAKGRRLEPGFPVREREIFLVNDRHKKWGRFVGISSNMVGLAILGMNHCIVIEAEAAAGAVIVTESGCVQTALPLLRSRRFMVALRLRRSTSTSK